MIERFLDQTEKEIKDEKERARDLDVKLREWERKIRNKRREIGGSNAGANFSTQSKKQEKTFENRLDHVSSSCSLLIIRFKVSIRQDQ